MTAPSICLIGPRGWVDLLTTDRLTVHLARDRDRGQEGLKYTSIYHPEVPVGLTVLGHVHARTLVSAVFAVSLELVLRACCSETKACSFTRCE